MFIVIAVAAGGGGDGGGGASVVAPMALIDKGVEGRVEVAGSCFLLNGKFRAVYTRAALQTGELQCINRPKSTYDLQPTADRLHNKERRIDTYPKDMKMNAGGYPAVCKQ